MGGAEIAAFHGKDPASIPWGETGSTNISESIGVFTAKAKAELHPQELIKEIAAGGLEFEQSEFGGFEFGQFGFGGFEFGQFEMGAVLCEPRWS